MADYQPLKIQVSNSGGFYSNIVDSDYGQLFCTKEKYGLYVKSFPFQVCPEIKNIVEEETRIGDGDRAYLPDKVLYNAYDLDVEFAITGESAKNANYTTSNKTVGSCIDKFLEEIKGKWVKMYDTYTKRGVQGVYLKGISKSPKYHRRGVYVIVTFTLKFRVQDPVFWTPETE